MKIIKVFDWDNFLMLLMGILVLIIIGIIGAVLSNDLIPLAIVGTIIIYFVLNMFKYKEQEKGESK